VGSGGDNLTLPQVLLMKDELVFVGIGSDDVVIVGADSFTKLDGVWTEDSVFSMGDC
jgi:hypothetical protein